MATDKFNRDRVQHDLPFADADAAAAEKANMLNCALALVECDLHLRVFVEMVHRADSRGTGLTLSHRELMARPRGLCCSLAKARETAMTARRLGLVTCEERMDQVGARAANRYGIDWGGVGRILRKQPRMADFESAAADGSARTDAPVPVAPGPPASWQPTPASWQPSREEYFINPPLSNSSSETGTGSGTGKWFPFTKDRVRATIPELIEAAERRIESLPASKLVYGAFKVVHDAHLEDVRAVIVWFRRQLSIDHPITSDSEADLLLVIGAALYALSVPHKEVKKNRAAIFSSTVGRGEWRKVLPFIPRARVRLDEAIGFLAGRGLNLNWSDGELAATANEEHR